MLLKRLLLFGIIFQAGGLSLFAQPGSLITISGRITDADTGLPLPYATIAAPEAERGTMADENGNFEIKVPEGTSYLRFTTVGYQEGKVNLKKRGDQSISVALQPAQNILQEVTVKPQKYRNKDNPAVELIKLVMENRDRNKLENLTFYSETQYEKILLGFSKMPEKLVQRKLWPT